MGIKVDLIVILVKLFIDDSMLRDPMIIYRKTEHNPILIYNNTALFLPWKISLSKLDLLYEGLKFGFVV